MKTMTQNIIYHNQDLDGFCSAAIVKRYLLESGFREEEINMIGWNYGDPSPLPVEGRIFLVDLYLEQSDMKFLACTPDTVWFDHHKSGIELSIKGNWDCINGERRIGDSASMITWKALFPNEPLPATVYWVDRFDTWKKTREDAVDDWETVMSIQYGLRALLKDPVCPGAFHAWQEALDNLSFSAVHAGKILYQHIKDENEITARRAFDLDFEGYKFCAINAFGNSEVAKTAVRLYHDGIMLFRYDGSCEQWVVSLYGTGCEVNGPVDMAAIALRYGGGGHAGASGFRIPTLSMLFAGIH